jgi:invasion protein IalB
MRLLRLGLIVGLLACGSSAVYGQASSEALIFKPWTKFCLKDQEADAKQVCFTGSAGQLVSGQPVIAAVLIEPETVGAKKLFRVTVPLGMQLAYGVRVTVDQGQPMRGSFVICFTNGCMSDYEANPETMTMLKKGLQLNMQAIDIGGGIFSMNLPLSGFAEAHEGPPTDPKIFQEQQKKLQEELKRRPRMTLRLSADLPPPPSPSVPAWQPPYLDAPIAEFSGASKLFPY